MGLYYLCSESKDTDQLPWRLCHGVKTNSKSLSFRSVKLRRKAVREIVTDKNYAPNTG